MDVGVQEFDEFLLGKFTFSDPTVSECVGKSQVLIQARIATRGNWYGLVEGLERDTSLLAFCVGPYRNRFVPRSNQRFERFCGI
jgi:hypothetical protein